MSAPTMVLFIDEVREDSVIVSVGIKTGDYKCKIVARELEVENKMAMEIQLIDLSFPKPSEN